MTRPPGVPPLVLASASPRRADVLRTLGLDFEVVPARIGESLLQGEDPRAHVRRLAGEKARAVRSGRPDGLILAGDTVVVLDGEILGKPEDEEAAIRTLMRLSGRTHRVATGLALVTPEGAEHAGVAVARVRFRAFGSDEAGEYAETGEPLDKAGAYGIQERGAALVSGITGDYYTVVGLPISLFIELLGRAGLRYGYGSLKPVLGR